ncbi:MAG: hypothetical protein SNJ74_02895 [Fimbriimonadaceae bacterium]
MTVSRTLRWAVPSWASFVFRVSRREAFAGERKAEPRLRPGFLADFQRMLEANVQLMVDQMKD